ncbi:MAG: hypothetical protein QGH40_17690, partial [bacterium]|nr:hypothetical protein [bacterium]
SLAALDARMFGCTSLARTVAFLSGLVKRGVTPDTVDTIKRYLTAVKRKIIIVCTCYVNHHRSHWPVVVDIRV